jgi:hypothetical protein
MMQATAHTWFNEMNFIGAAKACSLVFLSFSTLSNSTHFITENNPWGQTRARARRVGVRGSLARIKARTHNGAVAASLFPPQGTKAATDRASTSCEVSLE